MKIYIASTAPGTENKNKFLKTDRRLFSYYHILENQLTTNDIYIQVIKYNENIFRKYRNTQSKNNK